VLAKTVINFFLNGLDEEHYSRLVTVVKMNHKNFAWSGMKKMSTKTFTRRNSGVRSFRVDEMSLQISTVRWNWKLFYYCDQVDNYR